MENCPKCGGTGWRIVEKSGLSGATRCDCAEARRTRSITEAANIPPNYRAATLENFVIPKEKDNPTERKALSDVRLAVSGFAKAFPVVEPPGLLLIGNSGTGKTHLAVGAMKKLLDRGYECIFFDYQNLLDRIRSGYDAASGAADREAYRSALDVEVLVLDDLGAHRVTEWVEDTVTAIITYRCNHKKPIIATTNLPDEMLLERRKEKAARNKEFTPSRVPENAGPGQPAGAERSYKKTLGETIGARARSRLFEMCRVVEMQTTVDYREQTNPVGR
jgi:DNA replication protein DnaC